MSPNAEDTTSSLPHHVGIIMDGNGRWAKAQGKGRLEGHKKGAEVARNVVHWAKNLGIKQISLYAFSTENWQRPKLEVRGLMSLLSILLLKTLPEMMQNDVRFRTLGDISPLPNSAKKAVHQAVEETKNNRAIDLILCLNYGGQQEIISAAKHLLRHALRQDNPEQAVADLNPATFRERMWCRDIAPLDLLIRTGGEKRISNFHLWDAAYAELYFTDVLWPDYSQEHLSLALNDFQARERRYGLTSEQVQS